MAKRVEYTISCGSDPYWEGPFDKLCMAKAVLKKRRAFESKHDFAVRLKFGLIKIEYTVVERQK